MQKLLKNLVWISVIFLTCCSEEKQARQIPLEDFFKDPAKTSFRISPDGKYVSYRQPYKNRMNIYVQSLDGKHVTRVTHETQFNVTYYFWTNNNDLLFTTDNWRNKNAHMYAVSKNGKNLRGLLPVDHANAYLINGEVIINNQLLISRNERDSTIYDAYRLNLITGEVVLAEKNPGNIIKWYADERGKLRMALASDGVTETLLFRSRESDKFRPVISNNFKNKIIPVGYSKAEGNRIYALSNLNRDKKALVEFDCATGKESRVIYSHPQVDLTDAAYDANTHQILYVVYENTKREQKYLNDSIASIYKNLGKLLPNTEIRIVSDDSAKKQIIVRTFTDKSPGAYYRYALAEKKLIKLSDVSPSIREEDMCAMKPVSFKSRDGLIIHGYLTLPQGYKPKDLPVIVIPHGGPAERNTWGYSSEVQFLANRGYAVFQVNFRGSGGYGKNFWTAGFKKWGSDIQNDITDGVQWLIREGIADRTRIAIYGEGFGGYSALYGLSFHPELYRCGASQSGFLNLFSYIKAVPVDYKPVLQMYYEMVGNPEKEIDVLRAVSPVFHANKIKAPLLIAQDIADDRVNINETNQFVNELKKRQIPVTYITKTGREFTLRNAENRINFYQALEDFFESNLKQ